MIPTRLAMQGRRGSRNLCHKRLNSGDFPTAITLPKPSNDLPIIWASCNGPTATRGSRRWLIIGGEGGANGFTNEGKGLARETVNYVPIITGLSATRWRDDPPKSHDFRLDGDTPFLQSCLNLAKNRKMTRLAPPPPRNKLWGVQVGFGRNKSDAKANVRRLTQRCRGLVTSEKMDYLSVKSRVRGCPSYIMARIGRNTKDGADNLCRKIRATGYVCRVYKNKPSLDLVCKMLHCQFDRVRCGLTQATD